MEFDIRKIVKAGVKGVMASSPGFASVMQVWNEHESVEVARRLERFWKAFTLEVERNDARFAELEKTVEKGAAATSILERAVSISRTEVSDEKVQRIAKISVNSVLGGVERDAALNTLDFIEALNEDDLVLLSLFKGGKIWKVENLPGSRDRIGMGNLVVSLSKLESRGLIGQTSNKANGAALSWWGSAENWYNQWKRRNYEALPFGSVFIRLMSE